MTASLTKDMNSQVDLYRANAIRVLAKIIDAPMLGQIERYVKQAIVDRNCLVASSALVSGNQMCLESPAKRDIVRRWLNEVQEAIHARSEMVQASAVMQSVVGSRVASLARSTQARSQPAHSAVTRVSLTSPPLFLLCPAPLATVPRPLAAVQHEGARQAGRVQARAAAHARHPEECPGDVPPGALHLAAPARGPQARR